MVTQATGRARPRAVSPAASAPSARPPLVEVDGALLAAARRALARHGSAHATLERIADEGGLSRVTLYRRGLTRDALLAALAQDLRKRYREAVWPALTARGNAAGRLRRALAAVCEVAEESREVLLALGERSGAEPASGARTDVLSDGDFAEPIERLLRDGAADGSLRAELDARETAVALLHQVAWAHVHLRFGPRWSARRTRRVTLDLALRGVATP